MGEATDLPISPAIGVVAETVEITADPPALDPTTPSLGQALDERRLTESPMPAGNTVEPLEAESTQPS